MSDASQAKRRDCPLLEHAPLIILEIARDGTVLYANRTLSGAPVESVLGQPAHDFLPEGSRALSREMVDRAFRERKSVSYEVRDVFLAGKSFSIRIHVRPIEEDGASVTASVVVENITERAHLQESLGRRLEIEEILVSIAGDLIDVGPERTDEAISEALRRIASFLKAKRIAFFSFSEDGTRFSHTHAWAREGETELDRGPSGIERARFPWMTGKLLANEIVTLGPRESLPPEAAGERAFFERVGIEFAILVPVAKEGRVFGFVGATYDRAVPDPEDHLFVLRAFSFHVAGSLRNKLAAERARRDEVRFRGIFEQALVGIAIARGNPPRLLLANQAAAEMFGLSQEEFAKTIVEDPGRLIHPEDRAAVLARYASRLAGAVIPPHLEFRVVRKNGSTGWIAVFVSNVEYEGETAAQVVFIDSTKRKTAEESLRRSEEKYRILAESARDYIFLQDREMRIRYLNQACADFLGEERENLIGRPLADFMPPEMAVEREKNTRLVLESGRPARFQSEIRFHAGALVLDSILVPILSEAGEVDAVLAIARDITAQRRAEEELRRSEERYRLLAESAQEAIFVLGEDMRFRYANPAFAAMARHDRAYMIGRSMRELMPVEPAIERERNVRTVFEEREPRRFVSRVPLEWKTLVIDTTLVPLPEQPGEGRTVLGITRDITEQSRAEEELKKSEAKYRALAESSGDFIFLVGSDLRVGYVNSIASEYLALPRARIEGKRLSDLFPAEYAAPFEGGVRRVLEGRGPVHVERFFRAAGGAMWMTTTLTPIPDGEGGVRAVLGVSRDITGLKQAEDELRRHKDDLEVLVRERTERLRALERQQVEVERLASTGRMAARIAHEINNPLAGIRNSFILVKDAIPSDHQYARFVPIILKEIDYISFFIKQISTLHPMETEPPVDFSVEACARDVTTLLQRTCQKRGVLLETEIDEGPQVHLTESFLRQILYNLLLNAIEASPAGGRVLLRMYRSEEARLVVEVEDQGPGITPGDRERIYEPLFSTKDPGETGGLGLGLFNVRSIVQALGGAIGFECPDGGGTKFRVEIPLFAEGR